MAYNVIDQEAQELRLSKINSAGLINIRMSRLWDNVNSNAVKGNYGKWNAFLDRVWSELSGDAETDDVKEYVKLCLAIPKDKIKQNTGFQTVTDAQRLDLTKKYLSLMKKEMFLRKLMNKQGKGTAYYEESDDWE